MQKPFLTFELAIQPTVESSYPQFYNLPSHSTLTQQHQIRHLLDERKIWPSSPQALHWTALCKGRWLTQASPCVEKWHPSLLLPIPQCQTWEFWARDKQSMAPSLWSCFPPLLFDALLRWTELLLQPQQQFHKWHVGQASSQHPLLSY